MTLDEAIKHAEEVAEEHTKYNRYGGFESCDKCAEEHRQLAKWLRKYQKIEQIANDKNINGDLLRMSEIRWVIEDGNND